MFVCVYVILSSYYLNFSTSIIFFPLEDNTVKFQSRMHNRSPDHIQHHSHWEVELGFKLRASGSQSWALFPLLTQGNHHHPRRSILKLPKPEVDLEFVELSRGQKSREWETQAKGYNFQNRWSTEHTGYELCGSRQTMGSWIWNQ